MDAESLFSIVFVGFVAFFPFKLAHWVGTDLFHKNELIRDILPRVKESVGTVIGYTKGHSNESGGDYHAIIEHKINETDVIWAENSGQRNKDYYAIGKDVSFSYDSNDPRYVTIGDYRMLMKGDAIMRYAVLAFSLLVTGSLLSYFKFPSSISYLIIGAYLVGLLLGYRFGPFFRSDLKSKKRAQERRDKRLSEAQEIGEIPCDLTI